MGLTIATVLPRMSEDASETHSIPPSCRRWVCVQPTPDLRLPREGKQRLSPGLTLAAGTCTSTRSHKGPLGTPSGPAAKGRVGPPALPGPSSGIPLESLRPNASKCERRRQDPPSAMLAARTSAGPRNLGREWGGVGSSGAPSPGEGRQPWCPPARTGVEGAPRGTRSDHKRGLHRPAPPARTWAPLRPGTRPAPRPPPAVTAAPALRRAPSAGGAYKGAALAPSPLRRLGRRRPWRSPEARSRRARAPSRTK